jgi:hypothetical protein
VPSRSSCRAFCELLKKLSEPNAGVMPPEICG